MKANFEEKSYEQFFNAELSSKSSVYFPLGQVQEGFLGFDATVMSRNRRLWRLLGHPFWFFPDFIGLDLREIADEMERFLSIHINELPRMKTNLLFQYKRPQYIMSVLGSEWVHWNTPYYRYNLYSQQHRLLSHISNTFGSHVLVLYAAPAIHDVNQLVRVHQQNKIIENSNFKRAIDLNGHSRNTYQNAGTHSIACSEPSRIENIDLINLLQTLESDSRANEDNVDFIVNFRKQIVAIMNQGQTISFAFNALNDSYQYVARFPLLYSFLVMRNFKTLTGLQWLISL